MGGFVCVDVGASSTRYMASSGFLGILPNNVVFLREDEEVDLEAYSDELEECLEVIVESDNNPMFPVRALMGSLANRYSATNARPSVLANKHTQQINYLSAMVATALAVNRDKMDEDVSLYWALPPVEVRTAKDDVISKSLGRYTVKFPKYNNLEVRFNVVDVGAYEESFMALISFFFDSSGNIREKAKKYSTGNVLLLDIGASTSNLAIATDMRYLEKSGQTYKTGGAVAREFLTDDIRGIYGFELPNDLADTAIAEGRIQLGDTYENIGDLVEDAKRHMAEQVVGQIQGYFRKVDIPIQTVRAIVVSGGGSMQGQYVDTENGEDKVVLTSKPVSCFITEPLNKVCPGIVVEQYEGNPRLAVINGLYWRAHMDCMRKSRSKQQ